MNLATAPFASTILIAVLLLFAVCGYIGMLCSQSGCCIAEIVRGFTCPHASPLETVNFHFNVFKGFSTATVPGSFVIFLIMLALQTTVLALARFLLPDYTLSVPATRTRARACELPSPQEQRLSRWLAIRERSDPAFVR